MSQTSSSRSSTDIERITAILVPLRSHDTGLFNGTTIVVIGSLSVVVAVESVEGSVKVDVVLTELANQLVAH